MVQNSRFHRHAHSATSLKLPVKATKTQLLTSPVTFVLRRRQLDPKPLGKIPTAYFLDDAIEHGRSTRSMDLQHTDVTFFLLPVQRDGALGTFISICTPRISFRSTGLVWMHIEYLVMLVGLVQQPVSWRRLLANCPRLNLSTTKNLLVCLSSLTMDLLRMAGWLIEKSVLGNQHFFCLESMIFQNQGFGRL